MKMLLFPRAVLAVSIFTLTVASPGQAKELYSEPRSIVKVSTSEKLTSPSRPAPPSTTTRTSRARSPAKEVVRLETRELFLKREDSEKIVERSEKELSFEPWMPGRGALGVRVEVTW